MKINHIKIENVQGARFVDIDTTARINLIAGRNGAGKSSIADAVRLAMLGVADRVSLKKDLAMLVRDGAKAGRVTLSTDGGVVEATLPKLAKMAEPDPMLPFCLKPSLIAELDAKHLSATLFHLMRVPTDRKAVADRMKARGCDAELVEQVMPLLRAGFDAVVEKARTMAAEARGGWKAITGETYGTQKAEGWKPDVPRFDEADAEKAAADLKAVESRITAQTQDIARAEHATSEAKRRASDIAIWRERAATIPRITAKLEVDRAELTRVEAIVKKLEHASMTKGAMSCPCCGVMLRVQGGALVETDAQAGEADDIEKLPTYQQSLQVMRRAVANDERALADAQAAEKILQEVGQDTNDLRALADVDALRKELQATKASGAVLAEAVARFAAAKVAADNAERHEKKAAELHRAVLAWGEIEAMMSPDGIPGDLLNDAITPLNDRLLRTSQAAHWPIVAIRPDMTITYDGRPYMLLSESEKLRVDAVLGEAVAVLSGLRVLLLDRFDLLDLFGRSDLLDMLDASGDALDTVLILGTLKSQPEADDSMNTYWIEGGEVVQAMPQAA